MAVISEPKKIKDKLMIPEAGEEERKPTWQKKPRAHFNFPGQNGTKTRFTEGLLSSSSLLWEIDSIGGGEKYVTPCLLSSPCGFHQWPPFSAKVVATASVWRCSERIGEFWTSKNFFSNNSEKINTGYSQLFYYFSSFQVRLYRSTYDVRIDITLSHSRKYFWDLLSPGRYIFRTKLTTALDQIIPRSYLQFENLSRISFMLPGKFSHPSISRPSFSSLVQFSPPNE